MFFTSTVEFLVSDGVVISVAEDRAEMSPAEGVESLHFRLGEGPGASIVSEDGSDVHPV